MSDSKVVQAKSKRKEDELELKCLEEINTSLSEAKDKNNSHIPHEMACDMEQDDQQGGPCNAFGTRN